MAHSNIVTLSGWAQHADALRCLVPQAYALDYASAADPAMVGEKLHALGEIDVAVGWSLGGWLLMWATSHGFITPKRLVIFAAPAQFVRSASFSHGMGQESFSLFQQNFTTQPARTVARFSHLIAHGDRHYKQVRDALENTLSPTMDATYHAHWHRWLTLLGTQGHDDIHYDALPHTTLIYGDADQIVSPDQGEWLHRRIARSQLIMLRGCAHAPHHHQPEYMSKIIAQESTHARTL
ncbi:MAG: alpha/beta fold hydrolase [Sphaerospermopsis sp. SIO1G2]|nr:alpha/beta fold hydrolase [Sphaerospermopsis sp. SIO1G2]